MNQLDSTDVAILKIMQEDATLSTRQIAQRVGLSPTPVFERIRRMRSEGYIRLKADSTITSADLYAIYCIWCNDNTYKPLAARTVSLTLKKHADEFGLEHDNHITNSLGKQVNGFWGIEALISPGFCN